jgi:SAM-dependent methyltransferase
MLCEHPKEKAERHGYRLVCGVCGSYWDLESLASVVPYDASYPEMRGHYDPRVGALKVATLRKWLRQTGVNIDGKRVCEVGFGGGTCLPFLAERARKVIGLEANESAITRAREAGYRADYYLVDQLPARLPEPVDLWIFQDSWEHIPDPASFLQWMRANCAPGAEILMVLPRGDSLSRKVLGRLWPHKLPDHQFQWSRKGLVEFLGRRGFVPRAEFFPMKFVSPQMLVAHALHHAGAPQRFRKWLGGVAFSFPFNFGEMGLVLVEAPAPASGGTKGGSA